LAPQDPHAGAARALGIRLGPFIRHASRRSGCKPELAGGRRVLPRWHLWMDEE